MTLSVPPFADCTNVVPRLTRSDAPSLWRLMRPESESESADGPAMAGLEVCPSAGVPGMDDAGESFALSALRPMFVPRSEVTRSSTSRRAVEGPAVCGARLVSETLRGAEAATHLGRATLCVCLLAVGPGFAQCLELCALGLDFCSAFVGHGARVSSLA